MKHLKQFEKFKLPDRKPDVLFRSILSDITDEFGNDVKISINDRWSRDKIAVWVQIKQILRKNEIEDFCEEYLIPGIRRIEDEGFDFIPSGIFDKLFKTKNNIFYQGIDITLNGTETQFFIKFKNDLK